MTVVYRPFPTSNHNLIQESLRIIVLYIVRFLHQTTTYQSWKILHQKLYIVRFLHQTTTNDRGLRLRKSCISSVSYIKPQPCCCHRSCFVSCISSVSYIKPQLSWKILLNNSVVYRPFPTSNHNWTIAWNLFVSVVYRPFPTSNHNSDSYLYYFKWLYIVRFLHQTTTIFPHMRIARKLYIVRFLHQTTTCMDNHTKGQQLYIVRFLHQTTTSQLKVMLSLCCISSVSYIKPQLFGCLL